MRKIYAILSLIFLCAVLTGAQTIDDEDFQSWNDVLLTAPMTKKVDFFTQITGRFGGNLTNVSESRFAIGFTYNPSKAFAVSPFYTNISARSASGVFRIENQLALRAAYRFPFKRFGLAHRIQIEYRMRSSRNSYRYGAQMRFDKDIPKRFIPKAKFFVSDELFYDSIPGRFNRNRFSAGITKTLSKHLAVDLYYMRQNDGFAHPGDLNIIGTNWRVRL